MLIVSVIRLVVEILEIGIRLTIELLMLIGRLLAFMFRELIVPGAAAASAGLVGLAGAVAAKRAASSGAGWTDNDNQALDVWRRDAWRS